MPPALRGSYPEEPRWIDLSWFDAPGSLHGADPRFTERVADLSASIRGVERDTLIGENVRQHRKAVRLARAAIAALSTLLVLALIAGGLAILQRGEAVRQRDAATEQSLIARVGQLAATATSRAPTDLQSALLLADSAYRTQPDPGAVRALHEVLTTTPQLVGFTDFGAPVTAADADSDAAVLAAGLDSGQVIHVDRNTGERTEVMNLGAAVTFLAVSDDGTTIAAGSQDGSAI